MLIKTESFEEIKERFGDGELKSPFFIIEAGLNEGYDRLNYVLFVNHLIDIHDLLHYADSNRLVFVFK